jgi:hypothetical protein
MRWIPIASSFLANRDLLLAPEDHGGLLLAIAQRDIVNLQVFRESGVLRASGRWFHRLVYHLSVFQGSCMFPPRSGGPSRSAFGAKPSSRSSYTRN